MRLLSPAEIYASTERCLEYARALPPPQPRKPVTVHFFWQGRTFGAKPALCLKSFLATQDPRRFQAWLWLEDEETFNATASLPHLAPLLPRITVRRYDWAELSRHTPFADRAWTRNLSPVTRSDLARLVCLARYGGCYSDLDALFLRDLGPLLDLAGDAEFCFQWSGKPSGTNAFCRHHAGGAMIEAIMRRADAVQSAHSFDLFHFKLAPEEMLMMPVGFFSPLWLHYDGHERCALAPYRNFRGFFRKFGWLPGRRAPAGTITLDNFFRGAFTYHWHGQWSAPEHADSYAGHLDRDCNARLAALGPLPAYGSPADRP